MPQTTLWHATKALAWKHDCQIVNQMRAVRDQETKGSDEFFKLCNAPSIGSASPDTHMSDEALALERNFPALPKYRQELDKNIFTRLMTLTADAASASFRSSIKDAFPDATFEEGHSGVSDGSNLHVCFGPVKGIERTLVKYDEYAAEVKNGDVNNWPVAPHIKDSLRCTIVAPNGEAFASATNTLTREFDVRDRVPQMHV